MRGEIRHGAHVEVASCIEAAHRAAVTQADAIDLVGVQGLDMDGVAIVPALRQTIHESDRVAFSPAVGQRTCNKHYSQHDSSSKSTFRIAGGSEPVFGPCQ